MPKYRVREYEDITVERIYFIEAENEEEARIIAEYMSPDQKPAPKHATVVECDFDITEVRDA